MCKNDAIIYILIGGFYRLLNGLIDIDMCTTSVGDGANEGRDYRGTWSYHGRWRYHSLSAAFAGNKNWEAKPKMVAEIRRRSFVVRSHQPFSHGCRSSRTTQ